MATPALNYPIYSTETPVSYYGPRRKPRYAPFILGAAANLPQIYAIKEQERQAEKEFGLKQETLKQQTALEKERIRAISEASAAEIGSAQQLATERADRDRLLATKTARSNELIAQRQATTAEKTAKKARTLGYVKTGIQGLGVASELYKSGLFTKIGQAIGSVAGMIPGFG